MGLSCCLVDTTGPGPHPPGDPSIMACGPGDMYVHAAGACTPGLGWDTRSFSRSLLTADSCHLRGRSLMRVTGVMKAPHCLLPSLSPLLCPSLHGRTDGA